MTHSKTARSTFYVKYTYRTEIQFHDTTPSLCITYSSVFLFPVLCPLKKAMTCTHGAENPSGDEAGEGKSCVGPSLRALGAWIGRSLAPGSTWVFPVCLLTKEGLVDVSRLMVLRCRMRVSTPTALFPEKRTGSRAPSSLSVLGSKFNALDLQCQERAGVRVVNDARRGHGDLRVLLWQELFKRVVQTAQPCVCQKEAASPSPLSPLLVVVLSSRFPPTARTHWILCRSQRPGFPSADHRALAVGERAVVTFSGSLSS